MNWVIEKHQKIIIWKRILETLIKSKTVQKGSWNLEVESTDYAGKLEKLGVTVARAENRWLISLVALDSIGKQKPYIKTMSFSSLI